MVSDGNDQLKLSSPVINATLIDDLCADVLQCENDAREKYSCEDCNHSVVSYFECHSWPKKKRKNYLLQSHEKD